MLTVQSGDKISALHARTKKYKKKDTKKDTKKQPKPIYRCIRSGQQRQQQQQKLANEIV